MSVSVLIADDDPEFRSALAEVIERAPPLELAGAVEDAEAVIEMARLLHPDVALVDVRMGGGGGSHVARQLSLLAPEVRVLALSAYDDHGTVAEMLDAGASGYLVKGTPAREIVDAIVRTTAGDRVLSGELEPPVLREDAETGPDGPIHVILADDNAEFLEAVAAIIECDPGFEVVGKARDAPAAIRLATLYEPDVALVDWSMPGGGGAAAAHEITRVSPGTRVVALSASQESDVVLKMLRAGASSYVVKSVTGTELLGMLRATAAGRSALSPEVATPVIEELVVRLTAASPQQDREEEQSEAIRSLIDDSALRMVFQPIVSIAGNRVVGVEALARFDTEPRRSPNVWFDDAAKVGLATELDLAAAGRALAILPDLPPAVDLYVNVLPESVFSERFRELMATVTGDSVVLELTEHAPVHDYGRIRSAVGALRENGFRVAVDDVGAGYASLRHLLNLRPDALKIDISLCRAIDSDRARQVLAGALAELGRELGATVVAEGIETYAELSAVRDLGADSAQGFFLGRPTLPPLDEMLAAAGTGRRGHE